MRLTLLLFLSLGAFAQTPGYFALGVDQDGVGGAVDFSFLNASLEAEVTLRVAGPVAEYALDGAGARKAGVEVEMVEGGWRFRTEAETARYEVVAGE
jgi:hypothetical protein